MMQDGGQFETPESEPSLFRAVRRKLLIAACVVSAATGTASLYVLNRQVSNQWQGDAITGRVDVPPFKLDRAAFDRGVEAAKADMARGQPFFPSEEPPRWREHLDRQTGLRIEYYNCADNDEAYSTVKGYQSVILQYMEQDGPPPGSRKPWVKDLFSLDEYLAACAATTQPETLQPGARISSPDGVYVVSLWRKVDQTGCCYGAEQYEDQFLSGYITHGKNEPLPWTGRPLRHGWGPIKFAWGPPGSDTLILSTPFERGEGPEWFIGVLDLRYGDWLRYEVRPVANVSTRSDTQMPQP